MAPPQGWGGSTRLSQPLAAQINWQAIKENIEMRVSASNEQTALFFVRFQAVLHVIFSKFGLGRRNLHKTVTGVHLCERVVLSSAIHPEALMAESPRAPASNTGSAILATTYNP